MNPLNLSDLAGALFEEAGDALFLFDPDSDAILAVNAVGLRLCGFARDQLLKMPVTWLYRFDGRSSQSRLRRASQHSGIFHNQDGFELRTSDEKVWVPVNLTITRLHVQPKTLALITARDVREQRDAHDRLKRVEAELRRVLASVSDCIWSADIDAAGKWTYRYVSPVIEKITGRPADFFTSGGKHWWTVVYPEDRPCCQRAINHWRKGEASQEEYRVLHPDGGYRWVHDSVQASVGLAVSGIGRAVRLDGIMTDITERKQADDLLRQTVASERQAHQQLKQAQSQLVQSEKLAALGQLVAGIAHEINNPLAFVTNNTVVLQRDLGALRELLALYRESEPLLAAHAGPLLERIQAFCAEIDLEYTLTNIDGLLARSREGLLRIQSIVKGLRDFARLDESELKETDLNAGIESTISILRGEAKKKHIKLVLELAPLPEVLCYPARVNQVIMNLVANAIHACGAEGTVTVRTEPTAAGVAIHVIDNGSGIEPAVLARIFDPFFTTKPVGQGTGLGLSISHQIVEDHGGRMEVATEVGAGTHFTVHLPLQATPRSGRKRGDGSGEPLPGGRTAL
jgi:PAS domain S-box-containing protein